jgi:hypothetical protein
MRNSDSEIKLRQARLCGEEKAAEFGFTALPVDPFKIASAVGITVQAKPGSAIGVAGMLLKHGNSFGILYGTHIKSEGFQRFSVGHELGHYFLPGHIDAVLKNDLHESRAGIASNNPYEMEADQFSAGLLMPRKLFTPAIRKAGDGLAAIEYLAGLCNASLTSTAIRFTQCSTEPVAVIISTGKNVDYCLVSDTLKEIDGIDWIRKRELMSRNAPTFDFNQNVGKVRQPARVQGTSNLQDWFGGRRNLEINEDVIGLGGYGKTLTVLYGIEINDEDEANEDDLLESWTPRFRR